MYKDLIYMVTNDSNTVAAGSTVPLKTIVRRYGSAIQSSGNSVVLYKPGYYLVTATAVVSGGSAGDAVMTLQKAGQDLVGMTASETITTASTELRTLTIDGIVRVMCYEKGVALTLINDGAISLTTSNVSLSVDYYA